MLSRLTLTLALALAAPALQAQAVVQPIGVSDADALAEQVRRLGANPLDLDALLTAAELSLRLDDLSAAGSFLARADKISPGGARGQAIRGAILVRSERPGEALRYFQQAEAMGLPPARFAADRALAYDLVGDQARAQRAYRLALQQGGGDDETRRRYALSLGIAGRQREALDELAPLVRRNDRAAWRSRAFVLAMGGDAAEASRIASTMMPPGSAQGLKTFFAELPTLSAVDRAFAVHFGEVRPTPTRLADARLAPQVTPLPVEAAPVQVAVVTPAPAPVREKQRKRNEKLKPGRSALLDAAPVAVQVAAAPLPQPPAYQAPAYQPPAYTTARTSVASAVDRPLTPGEQASLAAATLRPGQRRGTRSVPTTQPPVTQPPVTLAAALPPRTIVPVRQPTVVQQAPAPTITVTPTLAATPRPTTTTPGDAAPVATGLGLAPPSVASTVADTPATPAVAATVPTATPPAPLVVPVASAPVAAAPTPRPVVATPRPQRLPRARADDILAKIVANLSIPASELDVARPAAGTRTTRATEKLAAADRKSAEKPVDRKAEAKKLAADRKAAADKKALADAAAAEKKAARAEPSRIWVQVAGGANEGDLAKAWAAARSKAPAAFAGRQGYTTPLRATNRVLTGPFKTDAEARAYVNQLAKSGVSAFAFTSDAGQKVSRLGGK